MIKLIDILKNRIQADESIESWLFKEVQSIIKKSTNYLRHVTSTMPEFDLHDSSHSEAVLEIIESFLGDNAQNLSSFELFFIIASAYLHDCGMAISDYEMKVMKLTEGTQDKFIFDGSLKNDGKKCLTYKEANVFISQNKDAIYQDFSKEIQNWLFVPHSENGLIDYLSNLLIEYQQFRNGKYSIIKSSRNFAETNQSLRVEYIRSTHHKRIYEYIKNWGNTSFSNFPISGLGQRIATDLASICKAHGEHDEYIGCLGKEVEYCGSDSINLQFVAMLLRLGDIVHFSNDRAPLELRSLHQFDSDYSFNQWKIKANGVNYNIENGKVAFRAFCTVPADYYELNNYVEGIDNELRLFQRLELSWDNKYRIPITDKVDRSNIAFDDSIFTPVPGLKFTLNQTKILDLLMGVGLYKDNYACIRELYQNSLDACRCQIAKDNAKGKTSKGIIEFGIDEDHGEKYLYCLDNGKGMSKEIIENYLLKVGSSYYQSSDFYQKQAETGFAFTPTSQFGIGILSCFILGDRIEIITKEDDGDYISCAIDGPREYFYYKKPLKIDEDLIVGSGTMVKVFLKENFKQIINTNVIHDINIVILNSDYYIQQLRPDLEEDYKNWTYSLYKIVDSFVVIVPEQISLYVKWNNGDKQEVLSKPIIYGSNTLKIEDFDLLDARINMFGKVCDYKSKDYIDLVDCYVFEIKQKGIQYKTIMKLPKPGIESYGCDVMKNIPINNSLGTCVDGISVSRGNWGLFSFVEKLTSHGVVNFYGDNRPQLSLDRTTIVYTPIGEYERIAKDIVKQVIEQAIAEAHNHINKYSIQQGSVLYNMVWTSILDCFCYSSSVFVETLSDCIYQSIQWENLSLFLDEKLSIGEFVHKDKVKINNYYYDKFDKVSQSIIMNKLFNASKIIVSENDVEIVSGNIHCDRVLDCAFKGDIIMNKYVARTNNYGNTFEEYDIISNLYPIVPDFLYNLFIPYGNDVLNDNFKKIGNFSNGIAAFFEQNPFEVDEELGLYIGSRNMVGGKKAHIRTLDNKRAIFYFSEIKTPIVESVDKKQCCLALTAYIAPKALSNEELDDLNAYKESNPSYYKGVTEGWSIIVTGEQDDKNNTFIKAGKHTRKDLINLIPDSFWEKYSDHIHVFPNGTILEDQKR